MAANTANALPARDKEPSRRARLRHHLGFDSVIGRRDGGLKSMEPHADMFDRIAELGRPSLNEERQLCRSISAAKDLIRTAQKSTTATMASELAKSEESLGRLRQQLGDTISVMQGLERRISDLEKGE